MFELKQRRTPPTPTHTTPPKCQSSDDLLIADTTKWYAFTKCGERSGERSGEERKIEKKRDKKKKLSWLTLVACLGLSCDNFLAAASIELAAPRNSFSAMTVGSS